MVLKRWSAVIITSVLLALPGFALAQQPAAPVAPPSGGAAGTEGRMDSGMMEKHKEWQARHEKMVAEMKAMDTRLNEKVAAMNAARGDQKVEAMAAVINELIAQRKEMRTNFGSMHHGMGCPKMGQQAAMPPDCPMMKHHAGMQADAPGKPCVK